MFMKDLQRIFPEHSAREITIGSNIHVYTCYIYPLVQHRLSLARCKTLRQMNGVLCALRIHCEDLRGRESASKASHDTMASLKVRDFKEYSNPRQRSLMPLSGKSALERAGVAQRYCFRTR